MDANTARQRSRTYAELARAFSEAEPGLEREFTRLFLGPGQPVAHTHESVYREGRTLGDTTLDVRHRLATEGLAPAGRTLPDHIGIELAFMGHLAAREALAWNRGDDEEAGDYIARQESFIQEHLTTWLPQFCHRVLVGRPHAHYANLARRTQDFVTGDAARVRTWRGKGPRASAVIVAERELWIASVGRACTLCEICVQVCRPGALQQVRRESSVILQFEASLCDGCAACERWCPEKTISVGRVPDGERPSGGELARSETVACPHCGQFHAPAAMVAKVQAQVGAADAALLRHLALCQNCKVMGVGLRRGFPSAQVPADRSL